MGFEFKKMEDANYEPRFGKKTDDKLKGLMICQEFCKTQFCKNILEHQMVCDLIGTVASKCRFAYVYDEGETYHTGKLKDAQEAIGENGKMIDSITRALSGQGYQTITGDELVKNKDKKTLDDYIN